jgi:hypothetical protein
LRLPAAVFSSRRVSAQRTGRPVRRASSAATNVYSPGSFFAPKPPPMYSQTTRTLSCGSPSSRATAARTPQMYCVEMYTVSSSPTHSHTAWCVSSELWRTVCVRHVPSTTTSASASARSTSPRS